MNSYLLNVLPPLHVLDHNDRRCRAREVDRENRTKHTHTYNHRAYSIPKKRHFPNKRRYDWISSSFFIITACTVALNLLANRETNLNCNIKRAR